MVVFIMEDFGCHIPKSSFVKKENREAVKCNRMRDEEERYNFICETDI